MSERIYKSEQAVSFYVGPESTSVNVHVKMEKYDNGETIISARYGNEVIGKVVTTDEAILSKVK